MTVWRWAILTRLSDSWESSSITAPDCECEIKIDYLPKEEAEVKRALIYEFHQSNTHRQAADSLLKKAAETESEHYLEAFSQSLELLTGSSPTTAYMDALTFFNERKRWLPG